MRHMMTEAQDRKLRSLEARGRLCQMATLAGKTCLCSAIASIDETLTDEFTQTTRTETMQYCRRHLQYLVKVWKWHGVKSGTDVTVTNDAEQVMVYHLSTMRRLQ